MFQLQFAIQKRVQKNKIIGISFNCHTADIKIDPKFNNRRYSMNARARFGTK